MATSPSSPSSSIDSKPTTRWRSGSTELAATISKETLASLPPRTDLEEGGGGEDST